MRQPPVVQALRAFALLAAVAIATLLLHDAAPDAVGYAAGIALLGVTATPTIALLLAAARTPAAVHPATRDLGRVGALVFGILGVAMILGAARFPNEWQLGGGFLIVAACAWAFAASWRMPGPSPLVRRSRLDAILVGLAALLPLVGAAFTMRPVQNVKLDRAYRTVMHSDLRSLALMQDARRDSLGAYGGRAAMQAMGWTTSSDVSVWLMASADAWRAIATHSGTHFECTIWGGARPDSLTYPGAEGEPSCRVP